MPYAIAGGVLALSFGVLARQAGLSGRGAARRPDGRRRLVGDGEPGRRAFDPHFLFGASAVQYVTWLGGTAIGAFGGGALGETRQLGLDAIFPAFFLALLLPELRDARSRSPTASACTSAPTPRGSRWPGSWSGAAARCCRRSRSPRS